MEKPEKKIEQIEQTQDALRDSIEEAKKLAEKAQRLLQQHKEAVERKSE